MVYLKNHKFLEFRIDWQVEVGMPGTDERFLSASKTKVVIRLFYGDQEWRAQALTLRSRKVVGGVHMPVCEHTYMCACVFLHLHMSNGMFVVVHTCLCIHAY